MAGAMSIEIEGEINLLKYDIHCLKDKLKNRKRVKSEE
jgi:hypothetical protein